MKSLKVIVNPDYQEGEKPGQFFEIKIEVKDDYNQLAVKRAVAKRLRCTVTSEIEIKE